MGKISQWFICLLLTTCAIELSAQKPVLTIPTKQAQFLTAYRVSPNGKYLLSADLYNSIKLYDLKSKKELFTFWGHTSAVYAIAIASDNRTVISGDMKGEIIFWDLNSGKIIKREPGKHTSTVVSLAISNDGKHMVSAEIDGYIAKWDLQKRDTLYKNLYSSLRLEKAQLSNDGKQIFFVAPDSTKTDSLSNLGFINTVNGELENSIFFSSALLRSADFSADGSFGYYVTGSPAELRCTDLKTSKTKFKFPIAMVPLAVAVLDEKRLIIQCSNPNKKISFIIFDLLQQKIEKTIETSINTFVNYGDKSLRIFPGIANQVTFINVNNLEICALDLMTSQVHVLNPTKSNNHDNPLFSGTSLYMGFDDGLLRKFDLRKSEPEIVYRDTISYLFALNENADDILLGGYKEWMVWNKTKQIITKRISEPDVPNYYPTPYRFFSPDRKRIAIPLKGGKLNLYNASDYVLLKTINLGLDINAATSDLWLNNNTIIFRHSANNELVLFDLDKNVVIKKITLKSLGKFVKVNDSTLVVDLLGGALGQLDLNTGLITFEKRMDLDSKFTYLVFATQINKLVLGLEDGEFVFLDPATLNITKRFKGHQTWTNPGDFSDDNKFYVSAARDGTHKIWDVKTGAELSTIIMLDKQDWVILGKNGLFDASPGAMKMMHYVVNDTLDHDEPWKVIGLSELKHRYYQPGLLPIQLGFTNQDLRVVPVLDHIELAPKISSSIEGNNVLSVQLKNQRGGIGRVAIFLNDAEVISDARPRKELDAKSSMLKITIDLNQFSNRFGKDSLNIKVIAWNGNNWLSSAPDNLKLKFSRNKGVVVTKTAQKLSEPPRLFALVFGTSDYSGTQIDLRYAGKDAVDFANALKLSAQKLFGVSAVNINAFYSETGDKAKLPEKRNFMLAMAELAKTMKPADILVVYMSGHGVNSGGVDGDFYYLTKEAAGADASYLADPAVRATSAISSEELTDMLNKITAMKKILVLDACASGKAAETMLTATRDVPASQVRALDRMKDRTGFYILSGSSADAVSYESSVYGQGLLTYSLLKAMKGAALRIDGGEEFIDVQKLLQYAVDEVPKLAEGIGGVQKPLYRSPDNQQSFDVGRADESTKTSIILAEPKPVFVAVGFQDPIELFDKLSISDLLNASLRENTAKGKFADFIFTEAKDYPGAFRISGTYELQNNQLNLKYVVTKNKVRIGETKNFSGSYANPKSFAEAFLKEIKISLSGRY